MQVTGELCVTFVVICFKLIVVTVFYYNIFCQKSISFTEKHRFEMYAYYKINPGKFLNDHNYTLIVLYMHEFSVCKTVYTTINYINICDICDIYTNLLLFYFLFLIIICVSMNSDCFLLINK